MIKNCFSWNHFCTNHASDGRGINDLIPLTVNRLTVNLPFVCAEKLLITEKAFESKFLRIFISRRFYMSSFIVMLAGIFAHKPQLTVSMFTRVNLLMVLNIPVHVNCIISMDILHVCLQIHILLKLAITNTALMHLPLSVIDHVLFELFPLDNFLTNFALNGGWLESLPMLKLGVYNQDLLCQELDLGTFFTRIKKVIVGEVSQAELLLVVFMDNLFMSLQVGLCLTCFVTQPTDV